MAAEACATSPVARRQTGSDRWFPAPNCSTATHIVCVLGNNGSPSGATMKTELLRFDGAFERDPAIDAWMKEHAGELGTIAHEWFEAMRKCGDEVRELLHDGCPVACLGDA